MIRKKAPHAKVLLHCDGAIRKFMPDLIDTGFEILNPIEGHLPGMDPVGLKRDFGQEMTFQGGVDIKKVLTRGTIEEVCREVRLRIEQMGKDGGYILAPAHNFTNDIPLQNMLAFFEAGQIWVSIPSNGKTKMMLEELRRNVLDTANLLPKYGLVWMAGGTVSPGTQKLDTWW